MKNKKVRNKGRFLNSILIINGIILAFQIISFIFKGSMHNNPLRFVTYPIWYDYVWILSLIVGAICLFYITFWKRWAVYLSGIKIITITLLQMFIVNLNQSYKGSVLLNNINEFNIKELLISSILIGLSFWAIFRKWQYFE